MKIGMMTKYSIQVFYNKTTNIKFKANIYHLNIHIVQLFYEPFKEIWNSDEKNNFLSQLSY